RNGKSAPNRGYRVALVGVARNSSSAFLLHAEHALHAVSVRASNHGRRVHRNHRVVARQVPCINDEVIGGALSRRPFERTPMNALQRQLVTACAAAIMTMAGTACATTSDTTSASSNAGTRLAQSTPSSTGATDTGGSSSSTSTPATTAPATPAAPSSTATGAMPNGTSSSATATSGANASQDAEARKIF